MRQTLMVGLGTVILIPGCSDTCRYATVYGGGTVSITLTSGDETPGVSGSGIATGPDLESMGGGYWIAEWDPTDRMGWGRVELSRTDTTACSATIVFVQFDDSPSADVELFADARSNPINEADADTAIPGQQDFPVSDYSAPSVASGSLTVDLVVWEDEDCGTSSVSMQWAFDEENPREHVVQPGCGN